MSLDESKFNWVNHKLSSIDRDLENVSFQHHSLMTYDSGIAHYFAHRYLHTNEPKFIDLSVDRIEKGIEYFSNHRVDFGFSNGIAGFTWLVKYLINQNLIDEGTIDTSETDFLIYKSALNDCEHKHYDFLDGMIGKAMIFLDDSSKQDYLFDLTKKLIDFSEKENGRITWFDYYTSKIPNSNSAVNQTNFGMAHGIPSILFFLALVYERGLLKNILDEVLISASNSLLEEEIATGESCFSYDSNSQGSSRLAWCYGDLGVALALIKVSDVLNNSAIRFEALRILEKSSLRRLEDSGIKSDLSLNRIEKGFCHGVAGISHMFNRLCARFHTFEALAVANSYWLDKLLESAEVNESYFSFEKGKGRSQWYHDTSLLSGSAGIGLVLMSHIDKGLPKWDRCLFTDI